MRFLLLIIVFQLIFSEFIHSQVLIYGDTRSNPTMHQKIVKTMMKHNPIAVFNTGDLVFSAKSNSDWQEFIDATADLRKNVPYYPIVGNHEKNTEEFDKIFKTTENKEWYSVNISNIQYIVINSNQDIRKDSEQYKWLEEQLTAAQKSASYTIVLFHHPPFSSGTHKKDPKNARKTIVPLFEKYGVDAVFSGHVHMYERILNNGIYYFVTGGGGAPLHNVGDKCNNSQKILRTYHFCELTVADNKLHLNVFDSDNNKIDSIDIEPKP